MRKIKRKCGKNIKKTMNKENAWDQKTEIGVAKGPVKVTPSATGGNV